MIILKKGIIKILDSSKNILKNIDYNNTVNMKDNNMKSINNLWEQEILAEFDFYIIYLGLLDKVISVNKTNKMYADIYKDIYEYNFLTKLLDIVNKKRQELVNKIINNSSIVINFNELNSIINTIPTKDVIETLYNNNYSFELDNIIKYFISSYYYGYNTTGLINIEKVDKKFNKYYKELINYKKENKHYLKTL